MLERWGIYCMGTPTRPAGWITDQYPKDGIQQGFPSQEMAKRFQECAWPAQGDVFGVHIWPLEES